MRHGDKLDQFRGLYVEHVSNKACGKGRVISYEEAYDRYRIAWDNPECISNKTHSRSQFRIIPQGGKMKRLHPLHSVRMISDTVNQTGCYFEEERCTGRSTAQALAYIAEAIRKPYTEIKLVDHHGTRLANHDLRAVVQQMVLLLSLDHFVFTADTITFGVV